MDLGDYFLPHFREVFNYHLLKYFLMAFLFVFFFWDSYDLNVGAFDIVPEVSEVALISFNYFFFLPTSFISTILSFTSVIVLLLPDEYFFAFSSGLDCCVWGDLSVFWQFVVPLYCGVSSLWVGLDE